MFENRGGGGAKCFPAAWNAAAKPCDICKSTEALMFCRKDTAFLCMACDVTLHALTKHERVWMCEVCEQAPACVTCKADAAALCVMCDRDIHSANPLARRHERIPVVPFFDYSDVVVNSTAGNLLDPVSVYGDIELNFPSDTPPAVRKSIDLFSAAEPFFDFSFTIQTDVRLESQLHDSVNDGVVPVQTTVPSKLFLAEGIVDLKSPGTRYEIDFTRCTAHSYNKNSSQSHSRSVSSSSMDAGVVQKKNSMIDTSNPYMLPVNGEGMTCTEKAKQFSAIDREARVLRYKEKRKNRKFEKKIRYASRKAYAEMRPRIRGRFAKRTELPTELDVDRWWFTAESNGFGAEMVYGVVPSF